MFTDIFCLFTSFYGDILLHHLRLKSLYQGFLTKIRLHPVNEPPRKSEKSILCVLKQSAPEISTTFKERCCRANTVVLFCLVHTFPDDCLCAFSIDQPPLDPPPPPSTTALSQLVITDLVSFIPPPLVHPVGPLGREHGHIVAVGLGDKKLLERVESQAGACVALLVVAQKKKSKKGNEFIV